MQHNAPEIQLLAKSPHDTANYYTMQAHTYILKIAHVGEDTDALESFAQPHLVGQDTCRATQYRQLQH